jgi:hypothetical protein
VAFYLFLVARGGIEPSTQGFSSHVSRVMQRRDGKVVLTSFLTANPKDIGIKVRSVEKLASQQVHALLQQFVLRHLSIWSQLVDDLRQQLGQPSGRMVGFDAPMLGDLRDIFRAQGISDLVA